MDLGMKCIKYMLFISNFLFWMIGFLMISIGTTISSIYSDFERFMESHHFSPSALMVAIGVITFLVAAFGFLGAIRESSMLVNLYSLLLCLVLILEVSAAIAAYSMRSDIVQKIDANMAEALSEYDHNESATNSWDFAQGRLQCCGVHDYRDWKNFQDFHGFLVKANDESFKIPNSCCAYPNCDTFYERGCLERLTYIVSECAYMLGCGAVSVALVQVLGIVFANVLAKAIRSAKTNMELKREQCRQIIYEELVSGSNEQKRNPMVYMPVYSNA